MLVGENGFSTLRRELRGNVMVMSGTLPPTAAPALAQQARDPNRSAYYRQPDGTTTINLQQSIGGERWNHLQDNVFNAIIPPNGPSICGRNATACNANIMMTAGSYHLGGCHVLLADGAVRFVTENIDAGNQSQGFDLGVNVSGAVNKGAESARGLWGALGTRNGNEMKSL
jgi:hypothetical protein